MKANAQKGCRALSTRLSDDVLTLTGQRPLSVQEFFRKNAAAFTAAVKAKEA